MSRQLSESNIELLEQFILSKSPMDSDSLPAISEGDKDDTIRDWKTITPTKKKNETKI